MDKDITYFDMRCTHLNDDEKKYILDRIESEDDACAIDALLIARTAGQWGSKS